MKSPYPEYSQLKLVEFEQCIAQFWDSCRIFERSLELRKNAPPFIFYEGPPSANGLPGIHHVISRTLKDIICRYQTMQGRYVNRKAGWDTHGLPVEISVEKMLGISKKDIGVSISTQAYNQHCRQEVLKYKDVWEKLTKQMAYWVDLSKPYITCENEYIESLWWCMQTLYKKNLLYKSISIQPYSPAAGTGLSSHELNQPGCYRNVKDTSVTALFKLKLNGAAQWLCAAAQDLPIHLMAWTTTPWTLPSNLGLSLGKQINYALIKTFNPYTHELNQLILAEELLGSYFKAEHEVEELASFNEKKNSLEKNSHL